MDVFVTKIDLAEHVTREKVWEIIQKWLTESPHYHIDAVDYGGEEMFTRVYGEVAANDSAADGTTTKSSADGTVPKNTPASLSILNTMIDGEPVFAVRFVYPEADNTWKTDLIYTDSDNSIRIRLSCGSNSYSSVLPRLHKPHLIKMLFDEKCCNDKANFPIVDTPIRLREEDLEKCCKLIQGEFMTCLPAVYISYSPLYGGYAVDPKLLAVKLSGIAHVLVEPNRRFAEKIRWLTDDKIAFGGYIGIYYPGTDYKEILSYREFFRDGKLDRRAFMDAIRAKVQQAALNYASVSDLTWDKIQIKFHKKKYLEQENLTEQKQVEMDDYIRAFDEENKQLRERISYLTAQLLSRDAQIEGLKRMRAREENALTLSKGNAVDYFPDEVVDCVLLALQKVFKTLPENTRPWEILKEILEGNQPTGQWEQVYDSIKRALHEKSLDGRRRMLEDCGFTVDPGTHDMVYFHDKKYSFSIAGTPSDYRAGDNLYSDIMKKISIEKV